MRWVHSFSDQLKSEFKEVKVGVIDPIGDGADNHSRESEPRCSQIMNAQPENRVVKKSKEDFGSKVKDSILRQ